MEETKSSEASKLFDKKPRLEETIPDTASKEGLLNEVVPLKRTNVGINTHKSEGGQNLTKARHTRPTRLKNQVSNVSKENLEKVATQEITFTPQAEVRGAELVKRDGTKGPKIFRQAKSKLAEIIKTIELFHVKVRTLDGSAKNAKLPNSPGHAFLRTSDEQTRKTTKEVQQEPTEPRRENTEKACSTYNANLCNIHISKSFSPKVFIVQNSRLELEFQSLLSDFQKECPEGFEQLESIAETLESLKIQEEIEVSEVFQDQETRSNQMWKAPSGLLVSLTRYPWKIFGIKTGVHLFPLSFLWAPDKLDFFKQPLFGGELMNPPYTDQIFILRVIFRLLIENTLFGKIFVLILPLWEHTAWFQVISESEKCTYVILEEPLEFYTTIHQPETDGEFHPAHFRTILVFIGVKGVPIHVDNNPQGRFKAMYNDIRNWKREDGILKTMQTDFPPEVALLLTRKELRQRFLSFSAEQKIYKLGIIPTILPELQRIKQEGLLLNAVDPLYFKDYYTHPIWRKTKYFSEKMIPHVRPIYSQHQIEERIQSIRPAKNLYPEPREPSTLTCTICHAKGHLARACHMKQATASRKLLDNALKALAKHVHHLPAPTLQKQDSWDKELQQLEQLEARFWDTFERKHRIKRSAFKARFGFSFLLPKIGTWWAVGAPKWVLKAIVWGVKLNFTSCPPPIEIPSNHSKEQEELLWEHLCKDCEKRILVPVPANFPKVVLPTFFVIQPGKIRLIYNGRYLNMYLATKSFRLPEIAQILNDIGIDGYFISFDLKSGYSQTRIHLDSMPYCCIRAKDPKTGEWVYFAYTGLPFGLSNAPLIFQKIMQVIRKYLERFFICIQFLDDFGIKIAATKDITREELMERVKFCVKIFERLGVVVNSKSITDPMTHPLFLGKVLDLNRGKLFTKWGSFEKLFKKMEELRTRSVVTLRELESLVGMFQGVSNKFANRWCTEIRELMAHALTIRVKKPKANPQIQIPKGFWPELIKSWTSYLNSYGCEQGTEEFNNPIYLITDASDAEQRGGGYILIDRDIISLNAFTIPSEYAINSTVAELYTVVECINQNLDEIHELLKYKDGITIISDNIAIQFYIMTARCKQPLQAELVTTLYEKLYAIEIPFSAMWQRRNTPQLKAADALTRQPTNFGITAKFLRQIKWWIGDFHIFHFSTPEKGYITVRNLKEARREKRTWLFMPFYDLYHCEDILKFLRVTNSSGYYLGPTTRLDKKTKLWLKNQELLQTFTVREGRAKGWYTRRISATPLPISLYKIRPPEC